uniref:centrosomal protein of 120 kDa n=1 Tax=Ciona intestinalis TaxID=7719 RepID=UPI000180D1C9|nr:centrosomal protein of 120 kDa [Ciona intestinalis]|eukprot:XP_002125886.1 centrosomal protein of 120 kDa [Ciona intestinalis]
MQKEGYLVVVSVLEGRNFPSRPKHNIVIECKFDGELLATDPVSHSDSPSFTTELAWEMDKKSLHQHRMHRTPIKLQCFAIDLATDTRENVGYIVLDLRGAQLKAQAEKWYTLLNTKYSRPKPSVKISMILEADEPKQAPFKAQEAPARTVPINVVDNVTPVLDEEEGCFQIGHRGPQSVIYVLSVTLGSAFNLEQLIPGNKQLPGINPGYFFYYSLFDSDITNDVFHNIFSPEITPERASIRIRSTIDHMKAYFSKNSALQVHLCCVDQLLGSTSVSFASFLSNKNLSMLGSSPIVIDGVFPLSPPDKSLEPNVVQPRVSVNVSLRREDVPINQEPRPAPSDTILETPRKEKSPEAAPNDEPVKDQNTVAVEPDIGGNAASTAQVDTDDDAASIHSERSHQSTAAKDPQSTPPPPQMLTVEDNSLATTETHTDIPGPTQHFRFSLDIKTISVLALPHACNVFVKYSYPFFGSFAPVMTGPVQVFKNSDVIVPRSLCVFDFACTHKLLTGTFRSLPITLELWHRDKETDDVLLGTSILTLSELLTTEKVKIQINQNGNKVQGIRQTRRGAIPVLTNTKKRIADLNLIATFEDLGQVLDQNIIRPQQKQSSQASDQQNIPKPNLKEKPEPENPRESNEYKAAIQLELWKSQEQEKFMKRMNELETQQIKVLTEEFKKRDKEREMLIAKRIAEYQQLENRLSQTNANLEKREMQVAATEQELSHIRVDMEREKERVVTEAKEATKRMKDDCIHQVQLERERRNVAEEQNKKLLKQINDIEQKYTELMAQFHEYKNQLSSRPEVRVEAELNLIRMEKAEVDRKLESITKSKLHYKQQWGRALKELAMMKKREQEHAMANLKQQQQELEALRLQYLAADEKKEMQNDQQKINEIQKELQLLKNDSGIKASIAIEPDQKLLKCEEINERVSRLIEERDTLLRTGVYNRSDRIISELDRQIKEEMQKQPKQ